MSQGKTSLNVKVKKMCTILLKNIRSKNKIHKPCINNETLSNIVKILLHLNYF